MDSLIREKNGVEEVWYSEEYLKRQMELAHRAGIHKGISVEFHSVIPINDENVDDLTEKFKERVDKKC